MNWDTDLTSFTKINSKYITVLNLKCETTTLLEDNIRKNLDGLGWGNDFLKTKKQNLWKKMIHWTSLKFKISSLWKTLLRQWKQATDWEKLFSKDISSNGMLCKI